VCHPQLRRGVTEPFRAGFLSRGTRSAVTAGQTKGEGEVDGTGEEGLPEDDTGDAGVAKATYPVEVRGAASDEDIGVVAPDEGFEERGVRRVAAVAQDEPADAGRDELLDEGLEGRRDRAPPTEGGDPLRPWVEADREPIARDVDAGAQDVRALDHGDGHDRPRGAGREREPDVVRLLEPARHLERHRDPSRDRADDLEVRGRLPLGPVEVDEVDDPRPLRDELLRDPVRAIGRRADPGRRAGPVHDT